MIKHIDYCTHISNLEDIDILTRKLFDVNIRLFNSSPQYREIVTLSINYLKWWCVTSKEGYKKPHGVSGANTGIPFNIVAYNTNNGPVAMINPKIIKRYGGKITGQSNCGSLTLPEPIEVTRDEFIDIDYFDENGDKISITKVDRKLGGLTIQHEVDHNLGILITNHV